MLKSVHSLLARPHEVSAVLSVNKVKQGVVIAGSECQDDENEACTLPSDSSRKSIHHTGGRIMSMHCTSREEANVNVKVGHYGAMISHILVPEVAARNKC